MKRKFRRRVIKEFNRQLKEYPYVFPYYEGDIIFDNNNHSHVCFARLCGTSAFKQACPHHKYFQKETNLIGSERCCDNCLYEVRVDFYRPTINCDINGSGKIGLLGKPQIKLYCDKKLIDTY